MSTTPSDHRKRVRLEAVAAEWGKSVRTLRRWEQNDPLNFPKPVEVIGNTRLYDLDVMDLYLAVKAERTMRGIEEED